MDDHPTSSAAPGRRLPLHLPAGAALAVAAVAAPSDGWRDAALAVAACALLGMTFVTARRHRGPRSFVVVAAALGLVYLVSIVSGDPQPGYASWRPVLLGLLTACCLGFALAHIIRSEHPYSLDGTVGDGLVVSLAAWLVAWVIVVHPLVDSGSSSILVIAVSALPLPIITLAFFLAVAVLVGHHTRTAAHWCLVGGLAAALTASLLSALVFSGHAGPAVQRVTTGLHILVCTAGVGLLRDPSAASVTLRPPVVRRRLLGRLLSTTGALVVPLVLFAVDGPHHFGDAVVRLVSALLLVGTVTYRVVNSVRTNLRAQAELLRGAHTDPLTDLPNRTVLLDRITKCLSESWHTEALPTLYFVDLDRFKNINDSLGHAAGDEVLVIVARRLLAAAPEGATVARLSGDEYVVLEPASKSPSAALATAEALLAVFREPLSISLGDVFVTASIGVASMSPTSSSTAEDLLRHSDTAMYRAKDAGRNCVAMYDESMHERVSHRLAVETALYRALDRRELRLFHQPILDLESGAVVGFEALMRWQRADGTIVSPAEFIPIAEDTGTIVPIGSWALLEALTQLRTWVDDGVCSATATMSVNVSPRQLSDPNFPAIVSEAINRSGVHPSMLWLEVTESVMIAEPELALATLKRLRSIGVRVALDDFGTGYSSLSLLQRFPLQRIKIDRAFVHGVADNPNDRSLVRTIVAMGRSLGLDMVAEGVETVHQLLVLNELGCTKAQGYLISHPMPADAMRTTVAALERLGQFHGLVAPRAS